ncbi:ROK family protein [Salsipaludibacter albus]|uniref:ROK family protein n=1 Tax=Salsipaludibacter albus TaxID=2849650 RepID=UPI001EE3F3BE|nr:ROK family protein [Salsipaludibacter albus]MBY5163314.1 ROK family protein [Salsipaludibacter albus]
MATVAGVDIGGTNISVALVDDEHQVGDRHKRSTPTDGPDAVLEVVAELLGELDEEPAAVGVGMPGPVDDGVVSHPPNLQNWPEPVDVGGRLSEAVAMPVAVGNDANVGVLGEWVAGAGRGSKFLLGVWMGTGVGGGLVLDGRPYTGSVGGAGEFGHMIVHAGGAQCGCGRRGCIEAYGGRANMERAAERAAAGGFPTTLFEIRDDKGKDRLTSSVWDRALDQGDKLAVRLFNEAVEAVAIGIASVINLLDVDRIVLGGGLAEKLGDDLAEQVEEAARPHVFLPSAKRQIVLAELEDDAGMVGAAALGRAAMLLG